MPGDALLVRADASPAIGVGHVMRCLAIAEAWAEDGGEVTFASGELPAGLADRVTRAGARLARAETPDEAAAVARARGARFAVLDGYHLGAPHQQALAAVARLLVVDDRGETATPAAALVLNQNANATPALYAGLPATLLLGTAYTLLRREFRALATAPRAIADVVRHVLVSFGGADVANLAPVAIAALASIAGLEALVIAGPANPRAGELRVPADARATIRIVPAVDDMAAQLAWADLAIVAAGSTCWELAACGVPMIAVAVADNQLAVADAVAGLGLGVVIARDAFTAATVRAEVLALAADQPARARMSRSGRATIDGRGARRVCAALHGGSGDPR